MLFKLPLESYSLSSGTFCSRNFPWVTAILRPVKVLMAGILRRDWNFFYGMFKTTEEKEISGTIENPETFRDSPQSPQGLGIRPNHSSMTDSLAGKTKFQRNLTWVVGSWLMIKQKLFWLKKIMMFLLKYRWFTGLQFSHSGIDAIPRQKQWIMSLEFEFGPCLTFHNQPIMSNVWWNGGISVARKTYNSKGTKLEAS